MAASKRSRIAVSDRCQSLVLTTARRGAGALGAIPQVWPGVPASVQAISPDPAASALNTPTWSRVRLNSRTPAVGIRPADGLKPLTPQKAAGRITDPLV